LSGASFSLKPGEVHALLGENGAGKSTLMKILGGDVQRDSGSVLINGVDPGALTPRKAQDIGIALTHQEISLCSDLSVAQNIFLGREPKKYGLLDNRKAVALATEILEGMNLDIDPNSLVRDLKLSRQQMVEIAKALSKDAKCIILDEPTSALATKEIDELFKMIQTLKGQGRGIAYISHRLEELSYIADRVTILRDGKHIETRNYSEFTLNEIISLMVGREITEKYPHVDAPLGDTVLEAINLNAGRLVRNISFKARAGEIVGIAGLVGAGRTELTRAIFGADKKQTGEIKVNGAIASVKSPVDAKQKGIVLVPEDRKRDGLCTKLSIRQNASLPNLDLLGKLGIVVKAREKKLANDTKDALMIKASSIEDDASSLSGGNQQKLVVGKWLARDSKAMIFDEPTRGIDVGAKVEIYNIMNRLKLQGIGIIFVSSEMQEILGMSDRIIVMCDGRITGELSRQEATQEKILDLATQFESKAI